VRTRPEHGSRLSRMLNPVAPCRAFCAPHFKAPGSTCWPCRSMPTLNGDLSFPCGDDPFRGLPQQVQHSRSAASAFRWNRLRPVRPSGSSAPPHVRMGGSVSAPSARCHWPDPTATGYLRAFAPLRGLTPSGSLRSARFLPAEPTSSKGPFVLRSPSALLFMTSANGSSFQTRYLPRGVGLHPPDVIRHLAL
jgi:hypothetical protein